MRFRKKYSTEIKIKIIFRYNEAYSIRVFTFNFSRVIFEKFGFKGWCLLNIIWQFNVIINLTLFKIILSQINKYLLSEWNAYKLSFLLSEFFAKKREKYILNYTK